MSLTAKAEGNMEDFPLVPEGVHLAVLYQIADIGLQEVFWAGEKKIKPKCYLTFEIPGCRLEDNRPMAISQMYTVSLHENATLSEHLEIWFGKKFTPEQREAGFDLRKLLGRACQISVIHNKSAKDNKVYANINGIMGLPEGMPAPAKPENPVVWYDCDDHDQEAFDALPAWIQKKVNREGRQTEEKGPETLPADDLPFRYHTS